MNYNQICDLAIKNGLSKEEAENFAMSMHLQGITDINLIISALRMKLTSN